MTKLGQKTSLYVSVENLNVDSRNVCFIVIAISVIRRECGALKVRFFDGIDWFSSVGNIFGTTNVATGARRDPVCELS